jgi:hypothetical protein
MQINAGKTVWLKEASEQWKRLPDEDIKHYQQEAQQEKEHHDVKNISMALMAQWSIFTSNFK